MIKQWAWQHDDWPNYTIDPGALEAEEFDFAARMENQSLRLAEADPDDQLALRVEWLTDEAVQTSAIEGEMLRRDSVQESLMRRMGLRPNARRHDNAEEGIAAMMVDLYGNATQPLNHGTLCDWHFALMRGNRQIDTIGDYRRYGDPMQIVSGGHYGKRQTVHYEAPPSAEVPREINRFINWFNEVTEKPKPLTALKIAALAHVRFELIHPFEDGNGRIGRALIEKALARMFGRPTMTPISTQIAKERTDYYAALESTGRLRQDVMNITAWGRWFAAVALRAQEHGRQAARATLTKAFVLDRMKSQLNDRQTKTLTRMFDAEPEGFKGGMSAGNYQSITQASTSTATRDLNALVEFGILRRTGSLRHTRYWLDWQSLEDLM